MYGHMTTCFTTFVSMHTLIKLVTCITIQIAQSVRTYITTKMKEFTAYIVTILANYS